MVVLFAATVTFVGIVLPLFQHPHEHGALGTNEPELTIAA